MDKSKEYDKLIEVAKMVKDKINNTSLNNKIVYATAILCTRPSDWFEEDNLVDIKIQIPKEFAEFMNNSSADMSLFVQQMMNTGMFMLSDNIDIIMKSIKDSINK